MQQVEAPPGGDHRPPTGPNDRDQRLGPFQRGESRGAVDNRHRPPRPRVTLPFGGSRFRGLGEVWPDGGGAAGGDVGGGGGDGAGDGFGGEGAVGEEAGGGGGEPVAGAAGVAAGGGGGRHHHGGAGALDQQGAPGAEGDRDPGGRPALGQQPGLGRHRGQGVAGDLGAKPAASARFGVASRAPGTGAGPRGWGSQTSGRLPGRPARAARTPGSAATPRP